MGEEKITSVRLGEYLNRRIEEGLEFLRDRNPHAGWDEEKLIRHAVSYGINQLIRQHVRKKTNLPGWCGSPPISEKAKEIVVENISLGGLGFKTADESYIKVNEVLEVEFVLDDATKAVVSKRVIIRHVYDNLVGAEFCEHEDPALSEVGKYIGARSEGPDGANHRKELQ